jgi:hypothetical protein
LRPLRPPSMISTKTCAAKLRACFATRACMTWSSIPTSLASWRTRRLGTPARGDLVLAGSIATGQVGRQVASDQITLLDQAGRGFDGAASVAIHVDDEGTPGRDMAIIQDGVLSRPATPAPTRSATSHRYACGFVKARSRGAPWSARALRSGNSAGTIAVRWLRRRRRC